MSFAYVDFSSSQHCIAVLAERVQCRLLQAGVYDFDHCISLRSNMQSESDQSQRQSNNALCRCLGAQYRNRSFGGHVVWKVARERMDWLADPGNPRTKIASTSNEGGASSVPPSYTPPIPLLPARLRRKRDSPFE